MYPLVKFKRATVGIIIYFYALLFIYAASSKLLDFDNFRVQLAQSPLLSAFATWVAIIVPTIELVIAGVLLFTKYRMQGLYSGYTLMVMFTAYIYIILNYSAYVPCSCGGVLEKMTWNQHLLFNIIVSIMAFLAILVYPTKNETSKMIQP